MRPCCDDCGLQHNIGGEAIYCDWEHGKRSPGLSKVAQTKIAAGFARHYDGTIEQVEVAAQLTGGQE